MSAVIADVCYVDSSGVGIIVMCDAKLRRAGGELRLVGAQGMVQEALAMTSVSKIVRLYPTVSQAIKDFRLA